MTQPVPDVELDFDDDGVAIYRGDPFSGTSYEVTPNGVQSELIYVDGQLEGRATDVVLATGVLIGETSYFHGMKHGPQREYFADGVLREERDYEYDVVLRVRVLDGHGVLLSEQSLSPDSAEGRILAQRHVIRFGLREPLALRRERRAGVGSKTRRSGSMRATYGGSTDEA